MTKYHQGRYICQNPSKYIGDVNNIVFRSGWEKIVFRRFDLDPNIIQWGSEEIAIPYTDRSTGKLRRYYPDLIAKIRKRDGTVEVVVIEIKPKKETVPPLREGLKERAFKRAVALYTKNISKWEACKIYCADRKFRFQILTEEHILGDKR